MFEWRKKTIVTIIDPATSPVKSLADIAKADAALAEIMAEDKKRQAAEAERQRYDKHVSLIKDEFRRMFRRDIWASIKSGGLVNGSLDRHMRQYYFPFDGVNFKAVVDPIPLSDPIIVLYAEKITAKGDSDADQTWVPIHRPADLIRFGIVS